MSDDSTADLPYVRVSTPKWDSKLSLKADTVYKVALNWRKDRTLFLSPVNRCTRPPSIAEASRLDRNIYAARITGGEKTNFTLFTQEGDEETLGFNSCFFTDAQNTVRFHDPEVPASSSFKTNAASHVKGDKPMTHHTSIASTSGSQTAGPEFSMTVTEYDG